MLEQEDHAIEDAGRLRAQEPRLDLFLQGLEEPREEGVAEGRALARGGEE